MAVQESGSVVTLSIRRVFGALLLHEVLQWAQFSLIFWFYLLLNYIRSARWKHFCLTFLYSSLLSLARRLTLHGEGYRLLTLLRLGLRRLYRQ